MPVFWTDTVTLYRRVETVTNGKTAISWTREVLNNCFFALTDRQYFDGQHVIRQPSFVVRIPATYAIFSNGDIVMKGEIAALTPDKTAPNAFAINVVHDNTKLKMTAHYYGSDA